MTKRGTLRELWQKREADGPVAMNVLDLPQGDSLHAAVPPKYLDVASETWAKNVAERLLISVKDAKHALLWATASTRNAISWPHADDDGLGTIVWVQAGGKYWVLARRRDSFSAVDEMSRTTVFQDWDIKDIDETQ